MRNKTAIEKSVNKKFDILIRKKLLFAKKNSALVLFFAMLSVPHRVHCVNVVV